MGIQAARLVLQQIHGPPPNLIDIRLKPDLVVRESTAPPPRGASRPRRRR